MIRIRRRPDGTIEIYYNRWLLYDLTACLLSAQAVVFLVLVVTFFLLGVTT